MKKIFIVTSTRADFGILKNLILELSQKKNVKLTTILTGTHFMKSFGYTIKDIIHNKDLNIKHKNFVTFDWKVLEVKNGLILIFMNDKDGAHEVIFLYLVYEI